MRKLTLLFVLTLLSVFLWSTGEVQGQITTGDPNNNTIEVPNLVGAIKNRNDSVAQQITCLALNVYHEARSSSQKDQASTAHVVLNRRAMRNYSDTVCGVIWEARQFSWTHDGMSDVPREKNAWLIAQRIAYLVYTENMDDFTSGATHYYAHALVKPRWAYGMHKQIIGKHTYLKD